MNFLILNLAVADIIVALFLIPRSIVAHTDNHPEGISGTVLCKFLTGGVLAWFALVASVFTLIVISLERYFAVLDPQIHRRQLNASRLKVGENISLVIFQCEDIRKLIRVSPSSVRSSWTCATATTTTTTTISTTVLLQLLTF